ncbi:MAG: hypothetical protein AABW65_03035 [Nanoarchaeota archaeon]
MEEKEKRIRAITKLYYSNPKVQEAMIKFSVGREVVPKYFEGFGKRPDIINYPSDIISLVDKGATSFHASEEIWNDPLQLSSEIDTLRMNELRKSWDLLIDIDSSFLDFSKIATKLIIAALEHHGVKNYGIKFSGSRGFHIILSGNAFPEEYDGIEKKEMFPEWPRAISEYLSDYIKIEYNKMASEILNDFESLKQRINVSKEDLMQTYCVVCENNAKKDYIAKLSCPICHLEVQRKNFRETKRKLKCLNEKCGGILEIKESVEYFYCETCKDKENEKISLNSDKHPESFEKIKGISAEKIAKLDLVLVAPRHLFRMPYSLHEKTCLASIVIKKEQIDSFSPKDADPLKVQVIDYLPINKEDGKKLLASALEWKKDKEYYEEKNERKKYANYEKINLQGIDESMFPKPIKKLLGGLKDGKKRGLFILITFFKSLGFSADYINSKIREWNKLNDPQLKEGYIKSQIDWHFRQKKQILPPNYENQNFYKDLNLLDEKPNAKNPISEVIRKIYSIR